MVAAGVSIAGGLQLLRGDDGFRRLLRHVATAEASMAAAVAFVALLAEFDQPQSRPPFAAAAGLSLGSAALFFVLLAALLKRSAVSGKPWRPSRVLVPRWRRLCFVAGLAVDHCRRLLGRWRFKVAVLASLPGTSRGGIRTWQTCRRRPSQSWVARCSSHLCTGNCSAALPCCGWRTRGDGGSSNLCLLVLVGSGFWIAQIALGWLAPILKASRVVHACRISAKAPRGLSGAALVEFIVALVILNIAP